MKRYFKLMSVVVILALVISTILIGYVHKSDVKAASSSKTSTQNKNVKYSWQKDTSPFKFDLYFYGAWGSFYRWNGTLVEKWITEATGVTPNIIVPTGDEKQYLNVMIASNNLPDAMVLEWYAPETKRLIKAGKIYSVNELCEKYAPEFWDMIPKEVKEYHKYEDGKLYYIPSFFTTKEEYEQGLEKHGARPLFIQRGLYKALGNPKINSTDDFLNLLRTIKKKYPKLKPFAIEPPVDVNQWGLTGSCTLAFFAGIFAPETYGRDTYLDSKGNIKFIFENQNFVEAVRFLNKIYREGLITSYELMMKHENYQDLVESAQYAVIARFPIDIWKQHNPKVLKLTKDEGKTYMPLPYFKYKGKNPQFAGGRGAGWVGSMVTKNAKNPGRIIRYFEYSWSDEGQLTNLFGKKDVTYYIDKNGMPRYKPEVLKELQEKPETLDTKYGFERRLLMWRSKWAGWQRIAMAPKEYEDYLRSVARYGVDIWGKGLDNLDPDPTSKEGVSYAKIKNIWNKYLVQMVLAKDDNTFKKAYENALKEMNKAGLEQVRKVMYQNHLKDLQKKKIMK